MRPCERKKDPITGPVDLGSVVGTRRLADELAHSRTSRPEALPELIQKPRRPFDIGEEQGHRPRRQRASRAVLSVHGPSLGGTGRDVHCPAVFDTLSDKLLATLGGLGRSGRLDEEAI